MFHQEASVETIKLVVLSIIWAGRVSLQNKMWYNKSRNSTALNKHFKNSTDPEIQTQDGGYSRW